MKTKKIGFRVQGLGIRIHTICTLFLSTALGLFFSPDCFANVLISKVSGKVEIYKGESQTAILAQAGNLLENNDCLKTLENGRIQLVFEDGSVIWLKENTEIKLSSLIYSEREIYLNRGRVRVRVTALKNSAKFSLKTPTAVAALRGTEFIMIATENDSNLLVLSGKVEMSSLITETGATPRVELISEGQKSQVTIKGEMSAPQEFTPEDLIIIQDDTWHKFEETIPEKTPQPGEQKEPEKKSELKEEKVKEEISQLKQEIRQFVQETKKEIAIINNIVREVRQSDFSTARTLRDINGNVVRVEQNLLRPDSYTVELLCLTQRDSYVYGGKFNYEGPSSKRTDYLDQKIVFNKALPEQITDWPAFIQTEGKDNLYPTEMSVEIANRTAEKNHYIRSDAKRNSTTKELEGNTYISPDGKIEYKLFEITSDDNKTGEYNTVSNDGGNSFWTTGEAPVFLGNSAGNKTNNVIWLKSEFYLINNNGSILDKSYLINSEGKDPFTVLKEIAGETIISVKKDTRTGTDYFGKNKTVPSNIDLVWTPDLIMTVAQKLATQISQISGKTSSSSIRYIN